MSEKNFSKAAEAFISKPEVDDKPKKVEEKKINTDKNISLKVTDDFYNAILKVAKSRELTMAAYIKMVVRADIDRN